jgi:predicted DNA-binding transcriptional regulator AlpA
MQVTVELPVRGKGRRGPLPAPLLLRKAEVAALLHRSQRWLMEMVRLRRAPAPIPVGPSRTLFWRADELRDWLADGCKPLADWDLEGRGRSCKAMTPSTSCSSRR